jgi:hypothetical protein
MRHKIREADIRDKLRIKEVSEFLRRVLPEPLVQPPPLPQKQSIVQTEVGAERTPPQTSQPAPFSREGEETSSEISDNADYVSAPYSMPSLLDSKYGIRKDGDAFMIGDSQMYVNTDGDITIKNTRFKGTEELWELLTRKNVNMERVSKTDLRTYWKILVKTNAHLTGYQPGYTLNITRGKTFREVIAPLFAEGRESTLRRRWKKY